MVCYETGVVFDSVRDASIAVGIKCDSSIRKAVNNHGTAVGFHWYYVDQKKPIMTQFKRSNYKPVRCVETGKEYESLVAAATDIGIKQSSSISKAICRSDTAGGYHWELL